MEADHSRGSARLRLTGSVGCRVGEFDPVYRRGWPVLPADRARRILLRFRMVPRERDHPKVLHAFSAGVLGVMSVVLPVLLVIVAIRLMRNSGKNSDNPAW